MIDFGHMVKRLCKTMKYKLVFFHVTFQYELSVAAIIKNEATYIEEWIRYHMVAGVEHFYLYDNGSSDDTVEILKKYVKKGIVDLNIIPGKAKQIPAYNDAIQNYQMQSRYIAFIDVDEFLFPVCGKDLKYINAMKNLVI